jgi:hypothetical protein
VLEEKGLRNYGTDAHPVRATGPWWRSGDPTRPHPCKGCPLIKFVPDELQKKNSHCWLIALNEKGETFDCLDRCGTQLELKEALASWLRSQITRIDQQLATSTKFAQT